MDDVAVGPRLPGVRRSTITNLRTVPPHAVLEHVVVTRLKSMKGLPQMRTSIRLAAIAFTAAAATLTASGAASAHPLNDASIAQKMRGHANPAAAMRAHPEMAPMMTAMMTAETSVAQKMRGHANPAAAMRAHPEMDRD